MIVTIINYFRNHKINRMIAEANDCLSEYKESLGPLNDLSYGYLIINNSPRLQHPNLRICFNLFKEDHNCPFPKFTVL